MLHRLETKSRHCVAYLQRTRSSDHPRSCRHSHCLWPCALCPVPRHPTSPVVRFHLTAGVFSSYALTYTAQARDICQQQHNHSHITTLREITHTMATLETIQLEHIPATHSVHVAVYKDIQNAEFLQQQLLSRNQEFEYAFIDASCVSRLFTLYLIQRPHMRTSSWLTKERGRERERESERLIHCPGRVKTPSPGSRAQGHHGPVWRQHEDAQRPLGDCLLPEPDQ